MEDKIYTLEEMRSLGIDTLKYKLMDEPVSQIDLAKTD